MLEGSFPSNPRPVSLPYKLASPITLDGQFFAGIRLAGVSAKQYRVQIVFGNDDAIGNLTSDILLPRVSARTSFSVLGGQFDLIEDGQGRITFNVDRPFENIPFSVVSTTTFRTFPVRR